MSIFDQAINDIFTVPDFTETLTSGSQTVTVISYSGTTDEQYTEWGADGGRGISVTCKTADWSPSRGDKAVFRGQTWKVDTIDTDSHGLCHTVRLKSVESR